MFNNDFKFEDLFKIDESSFESLKEAAKRIDDTSKAARKCLTLQEFQIYRIQFEKAQSAIINKMIQYTKDFFESDTGDLNKYGANMARFITKLQDLRILLGQVESDAKKGEKNEA